MRKYAPRLRVMLNWDVCQFMGNNCIMITVYDRFAGAAPSITGTWSQRSVHLDALSHSDNKLGFLLKQVRRAKAFHIKCRVNPQP